MGLFSFVKEAGEKLFKRGDEPAAPEATPEIKYEAPVILSQEEIDSNKADELISLIKSLGLSIDNLYVAVEGDLVTLAGDTDSQAEKEKAILAVGNVSGIAQVDDQINVNSPEPEPQPEAQYHTVVSGDTLGKIAKHYYGDAMKYPMIFEANQPMLKDPNLIYAGQVLRIPAIG